jgi:hypothetical protein
LSAAALKCTKSGGLKISRTISSALVLIDPDGLSILKRRQNKLHVLSHTVYTQDGHILPYPGLVVKKCIDEFELVREGV